MRETELEKDIDKFNKSLGFKNVKLRLSPGSYDESVEIEVDRKWWEISYDHYEGRMKLKEVV